MKGNNTMTVNESTMIEAMQLLADRDMPGAGKVTGVKVSAESRGGGSVGAFAVTFEQSDTPPAP